LPLTALLHCMDSVTNPWWLGGNISAGVPCGAEIAAKLGARLWISAHDGDKDVRGLVTGMLKTRRWRADEIEDVLESRLSGGDKGSDKEVIDQSNALEKSKGPRKGGGTEVLRLTCGEEILVSGTGRLWRGVADDDDENENNVRLDSGLITETRIAPPPIPISMPKNLAVNAAGAHHTSVHTHHHQGKYYNKKVPAEAVDIPQIQNAMSPKKQGIYKALRTKDLIMPSPRLTMERRDLTPTITTTPTIARTGTTTARAARPGVGPPGTLTRRPIETAAIDVAAVALQPPANIMPLFKGKKEARNAPVARVELPA
jgi:hypothetical protein